jgi:hypothetical protein
VIREGCLGNDPASIISLLRDRELIQDGLLLIAEAAVSQLIQDVWLAPLRR